MILPLFARRFSELGAGVEVLGISAMAYALTSTLAAPFMGALADRFGRRPLVLVSLAVYAAAFCGYLLAQSAAAFIVIRGMAGVFTAGLIPAVTGLAADLAPSDRQAQWIGFMNAGGSIGWIAGPIAGGMIYDRWGYSAALIVSIIMAIITLLVALLYVPESHLASAVSLAGAERRVTGSQPKKPMVSCSIYGALSPIHFPPLSFCCSSFLPFYSPGHSSSPGSCSMPTTILAGPHPCLD